MIPAVLILAAATFAYIAARLYFSSYFGVCHSDREMLGKTVIITGANSGIGFETALDLARRDGRIILACRDLTKGERAVKYIIRTTGNIKVILKHLDLSSFKSIRKFANDILNTEDRLDILINNAGVIPSKKTITVDGLEIGMATNHYGPFLLTNLLLPLLIKSSQARIVIVSSLAHEVARLDFENLNAEKYFTMFDAYTKSKLANVVFMRALAKKLEGTGVTANALHPGLIQTPLINVTYMTGLATVALWPILKTRKEGAQTSIYLAVSEELDGVSGKYFSDCRERKLWKRVKDPDVTERLWLHSEEVTGLKKTEEIKW